MDESVRLDNLLASYASRESFLSICARSLVPILERLLLPETNEYL